MNRRTRKDILEEVREFLSNFKNTKPTKDTEEETFGWFSDYYDPSASLFVSFYLKGRYHILLCSEIWTYDDLGNEEIYNMIVTSDNPDDIIAEIDFDNTSSMYAFITSCSVKLP